MVDFQLSYSLVHVFELIFYLFRRRSARWLIFLLYVTLNGLEWLSTHAAIMFLSQLVRIPWTLLKMRHTDLLTHYLNRHLRWTLCAEVIHCSVLKVALFMGHNIELLRQFSIWALNRGDPIKIMVTLTLARCIHILFSYLDLLYIEWLFLKALFQLANLTARWARNIYMLKVLGRHQLALLRVVWFPFLIKVNVDILEIVYLRPLGGFLALL